MADLWIRLDLDCRYLVAVLTFLGLSGVFVINGDSAFEAVKTEVFCWSDCRPFDVLLKFIIFNLIFYITKNDLVVIIYI